MRFLVDMPLSPGLADWLVQGGHDAVHASAIGLARAPDTEILERARDQERIVVIERLVKALEVTIEDDLYGSLITIERWRIRKRRLPIADQ